jgi:hypothetical protein
MPARDEQSSRHPKRRWDFRNGLSPVHQQSRCSVMQAFVMWSSNSFPQSAGADS